MTCVSFHYWFGYESLTILCVGLDWIVTAYVLTGYALIVGGVAGGFDRRTRELAERIALESTQDKDRENIVAPSHSSHVETHGSNISPGRIGMDQLRLRLKSPLSWVLNLSIMVVIIVLIAVMVFKPGHQS